MSEAEIIDDYPELTQDDIRACLAFSSIRDGADGKALFSSTLPTAFWQWIA